MSRNKCRGASRNHSESNPANRASQTRHAHFAKSTPPSLFQHKHSELLLCIQLISRRIQLPTSHDRPTLPFYPLKKLQCFCLPPIRLHRCSLVPQFLFFAANKKVHRERKASKQTKISQPVISKREILYLRMLIWA